MNLRSLMAFLLFTTMVLACSSPPESTANDGAAATPEATADEAPPAKAEKPSAGGPCDLLTSEEVAEAIGADASTVSAGAPGPFSSADAQDCVWESVHDGLEETVTLWMRSRTEQTSPDAWSNAIGGLIENGETIGSQTLTHEPAALGGTEGGALSGVHGGAFVKSRIYSWQIDEETYYRLTVSRSPGEGDAELVEPPDEIFGRLVEAIMQ